MTDSKAREVIKELQDSKWYSYDYYKLALPALQTALGWHDKIKELSAQLEQAKSNLDKTCDTLDYSVEEVQSLRAQLATKPKEWTEDDIWNILKGEK